MESALLMKTLTTLSSSGVSVKSTVNSLLWGVIGRSKPSVCDSTVLRHGVMKHWRAVSAAMRSPCFNSNFSIMTTLAVPSTMAAIRLAAPTVCVASHLVYMRLYEPI
ncbi:hypothetical protein HAX54_047343 [Datura stramonium]|uniref:Secreted protein n=1 Tax=Datura stramonium TaxID=4076 RepID=A0ABS8SSY6_DATST|nr:hypothetical protein [Datura stramonium]